MTTYKHVKIVESNERDPHNEIDAGTLTVHVGKDTNPDYTVLGDEQVLKITHDVVEQYEAPRPMSKREILEYAKEQYFDSANDRGTEGEK